MAERRDRDQAREVMGRREAAARGWALVKRRPLKGEVVAGDRFHLADLATGAPVAGWREGRGTLSIGEVERLLGYDRAARQRAPHRKA